MSAGFTPGPWYITGEDDRRYIREEASDACVTLILDGGHVNPKEAMPEAEIAANGNLIAAAPDLYAAAEAVAGWIADLGRFAQRGEQPHPVFQTLAAALAKARGEVA